MKNLVQRKDKYTLSDFCGNLNNIINKFEHYFSNPNEFSLDLYITKKGYYDDEYELCIDFDYQQLETDEEYNKRIKEEEKVALKEKEDKKKAREKRKREQLKYKESIEKQARKLGLL